MSMKLKKENIPIVVALSLPVLLILAVGILSLVAGRNVRSSHDFVYAQSQSVYWTDRDCYTYRSYYSIDESGHLKLVPYQSSVLDASNRLPYDPCKDSGRRRSAEAPDLYRYDSKSDTARILSKDEALALAFTKGSVSPDGYTVDYRTGNGGLLDVFGGSSDSGIFINKRNQHRQLPGFVTDEQNYYSEDFSFVGWVK